MCGAPVGPPPAVTPAPVALVLPVPSPAVETLPVVPSTELPPAPPSVELPPAPSIELPPPPSVEPSVAMSTPIDLPPQRANAPEPAPLAPSPSEHHGNPFLIAGGTFVALLVVVVLVFALPAHGAKSNQPPRLVGNPAAARLDLQHLATAEETNLTATMSYTTDIAALEGVGYVPTPGLVSTIRAGIHGTKGYCLVATNGPSSRWYLYDSKQGGLISQSFASETAAEQACAIGKIKSYATIS
jgi:hypothetical protein